MQSLICYRKFRIIYGTILYIARIEPWMITIFIVFAFTRLRCCATSYSGNFFYSFHHNSIPPNSLSSSAISLRISSTFSSFSGT